MPAEIVLVDGDVAFLESARSVAMSEGFAVTAFADSMDALNALEAARIVDLIITSLQFPRFKPNGLALVRMTRVKRPAVSAIFFGDAGLADHVDGFGQFLPTAVTSPL